MWEYLKKKYVEAQNLRSDGCTASPDLFWKECCEEHDFYYRHPEIAGISRKEADKRLRLCMRKKGSGRIISGIYWLAVRLFGGRAYKG